MKEKLFKPRALILYALALIAGAVAAWPAFANITVTPMLIVMEGRDRYADVNLVNTGGNTESYAITWRHMKMVEGTGAYEPVETSNTTFDLAQHVVMTPRRVSIEPGGMQKIRLGLRLKGEPPAPGDYRAHLEMTNDTRPDTSGAKPAKEGEVTVGVKINVGVSIPVIYRVGESDVTATIGDISTQINEKSKGIEVNVPVTRSGGPFGIYGHIKIMSGGKIVGEVKNANLFAEINQRTFVIPLNIDNDLGQTLEIVYKHYSPKNDTVFAQKTFNVR